MPERKRGQVAPMIRLGPKGCLWLLVAVIAAGVLIGLSGGEPPR